MTKEFTRRAAIGASATTAAALAFAAPAAAAARADRTPPNGPDRIRHCYARQKVTAGGRWHSHIASLGATITPIVEDDADFVLKGYSVQKLAVAVAVMDKVDRGLLRLDQKLELTRDIINVGSGIYRLQNAHGDQLTLSNILVALLLMSDNTAVRLVGLVTPPLEINEILAAKGFVHTRVEPHATNPHRYGLGWTTPRETHDLLVRLVNRTIVSSASAGFLLSILRWQNGYHDGIRRNMSSAERSRVATKYGADFNTLGASRHEAGIIFAASGAPALTYSLFAEGLAQLDNYGGTHPGVEAHAALGRVLFDAATATANPNPAAARHSVEEFQEVDGG